MTGNETIHIEAVALLSAAAEASAPLETLRQGLSDYQNGSFSGIAAKTPYLWEIGLQEQTKIYYVTLDLDLYQFSGCTCRSGTYCRHMAAAFFHLYKRYANPEQWMQDVETTADETAPEKLEGESEASAAVPENFMAIAQDADFAAMDRLLKKLVFPDGLSSLADPELAIRRYREVKSEIAGRFPLPETIGYIHLYVILLEAMHERCLELSPLFSDDSSDELQLITRSASELLRQAGEEMTEVFDIHESLEPTVVQYVVELSAAVHSRWTEQRNSPVDWPFLYRMLWWRSWAHPQLAEAEALRLSALAENFRREKLMALAHLDVLLSRDQDALDKWSSSGGETDFRPLFFYFLQFSRSGQWRRLQLWLTAALDYASGLDNAQFDRYIRLWLELNEQLADSAALIAALNTLLPRSYSYYAEYLLLHKQYEQWINLHLLHRIAPEQIAPGALGTVHAEKPELLLPLYHQALNVALAQRSRQAYKRAVALLSELKKRYAELSMGARFDLFLTRLIRQHQHLNAFQEELQKGKLLV